jgi:iron complex outermembrane recepter protein
MDTLMPGRASGKVEVYLLFTILRGGGIIMKKIGFLFFTLAMGFALGIGVNSYSIAQQSASQPEEFTLEEITVTAEKRVENAQKASVALTAITGEDIQEKSFDKLENVLGSVPGLSVQATSPTGSGVYIRGVGSNVDTNIADPSVAINIDGVYYSKGEVAFSTMYDTERVEVLRGPQGTLYGRNAIGGTVNVVSKNPTDSLDVSANVKIGNFNLREYDAVLNVPLTEKLWSRFSVMKQDRDSYYSPNGDSANKLGFRVKLYYKPTDSLAINFTYDYSADKGYGKPQVPVPGSAGKLFIPMPGLLYPEILTTGWVTAPLSDAWATDEYHPAPKQDNWFQTYSLQMNYDFPWASLTVFPSVAKNHRDFLLVGAIFGTILGETEESQADVSSPYEETQYSMEVRLQSPADSNIKWMAGYYGQKSENDAVNASEDPTTFDDTDWHTIIYNQPTLTNAYFAQLTIPFTDQFRVTAGARKSTDDREKKYRFAINGGLVPGNDYYEEGGSTGSYDSGVLKYKDSAGNTTYKAGIEFDLSDSSMTYAQLTTGFKAGGLNQTIPPEIFKPEELTSYSIGSKNRFLGNTLQVNFEGYYYDYNNFQVQIGIFRPNTLTGAMEMVPMYVTNAKKGTMYGAELETDWAASQNDLLKASLSWMHTEYGSVVLPPNPFAGTPPTDIKGWQMSNSPNWVVILGYDHTIALDDGAQIITNLNTKISAQYYATPEEYLPGALQESYHLSNASATYYAASGKWSLGLWCNNIENKAQTLRTHPLYRRLITDPRTIGLSLNLKL